MTEPWPPPDPADRREAFFVTFTYDPGPPSEFWRDPHQVPYRMDRP